MPVSMIDRVPTTNWYLYLFVWLHRSHKDTLVNRKKEKRWLRWAYCINFNIETRSASETHIAIQSTIHLFLSARTKCIKVWMYGRWNWIFPWDESRRRKKNVSDGIDSYAGPEREWGAHAALEHTANEISTIHMRECMCIVLPSYLFNVSTMYINVYQNRIQAFFIVTVNRPRSILLMCRCRRRRRWRQRRWRHLHFHTLDDDTNTHLVAHDNRKTRFCLQFYIGHPHTHTIEDKYKFHLFFFCVL